MASKLVNSIDAEGIEIYFSAEEDVQQQDRQSELKTVTQTGQKTYCIDAWKI